jgi:hypothetical protein
MFRALRLLLAAAICLVTVGSTALFVAPQAEAALTTHDWLGVWLSGHNVVWIAGTPTDTLSVVGSAYGQLEGGSVIDARLDFEAVPGGKTLSMIVGGSGDCAAQMTNTGATLIVRDNGRCKGGNVRFNGVYVHQ